MADIDNNSGLKDVANIPEAQVVGANSPLERDDTYTGKVKVVNNITGEILEREYHSIHEAKALYQEIAASESAFKRAKDKLKTPIESFMSNYDEYDFADGDRIYWGSTSRKSISYTNVAESLGKDVASLFSEINVGKLEEYLQECVNRHEMTYEEKDAVLSKVTVVTGKPFVKFGKAKR
jgi:DNA-directed RNA polymerase subunit F